VRISGTFSTNLGQFPVFSVMFATWQAEMQSQLQEQLRKQREEQLKAMQQQFEVCCLSVSVSCLCPSARLVDTAVQRMDCVGPSGLVHQAFSSSENSYYTSFFVRFCTLWSVWTETVQVTELRRTLSSPELCRLLPDPNALVAVSKGMQAAKLCSDRFLQF